MLMKVIFKLKMIGLNTFMKSGSILTFAFAMVLFQEGCSPSAATPTPDAGLDAQAAPSEEAGPDTFCNTRRQLSFCEDFDEKSLPGAFVGFAPDASVQAEIIADPLAPSAPRALILQTTGISRGAWFRTRPLAHKGKMNALIMVRTPSNSRPTLAAPCTSPASTPKPAAAC